MKGNNVLSSISSCRLCDSSCVTLVWSFGNTPLANAFVAADSLDDPEIIAPLDVCRCKHCQLVQLRHTVSPEVLFRNYLYVSSTSQTFMAHFNAYASQCIKRFGLTPQTLVVEIGSNDGVLLKPLSARGIPVIGVEPAEKIAAQANLEGIKTIPTFFTPAVAEQIRQQQGTAKVITCNNAFAHIPDLDDIVQGIKCLMTEDSVFVFEVQYLTDLLEKNLFDLVYHEHLFYYHLSPLILFFSKYGLKIFDVERTSVHGGSIRVFVECEHGPYVVTEGVKEMLSAENEAGLNTDLPYFAFADRIRQNKQKIKSLLRHIKDQGKRVVGYGAPAKATTLMYTFEIGKETLEYIVDDDRRFKQGRFMPGSHIPIVEPARLLADKPDYCLILAWNFAEPIMKSHARFLQQGGQFIIPIPTPRVIQNESSNFN